MADVALTPMLRQYRTLKQQQCESILLFRMGDFYEMFYEDAQVASRLLDLTLTARGRGTDHVVPMCGFPYHQLDHYTGRLVRAQRRVAICDQVEDPRLAKGLVRREVVRVVTPGTLNDPEELEAKANLWIAAVAPAAGRLGAAFLDASTGEFLAWETEGTDAFAWQQLAERLESFAPREIVFPEGWRFDGEGLGGHAVRTPSDPVSFAPAGAAAVLARQFGVASLDGFGLRDRPAAVAAGAGLLLYVQGTQRSRMEHIDRLLYDEPARAVLLDPATRRNLELERSLRDGGREGSLLHALDQTSTAMGGRLLRAWLLAPLIDPPAIAERHDAVAWLVEDGARRARVREALAPVHDMERLLGRVVAGTAGARDLLGLKLSLERLPGLATALASAPPRLLAAGPAALDPCPDIARRIGDGLVDEPPATLREGGVIRDGFDAELDELRAIRRDGRSTIASIEARERASTGISSLKVRFNKVFGYYIEVTKANLALVPERYQRKQTIAGGERYVTPELKEYEARVLKAQERIEELELELFRRLRSEVALGAPRLKAAARDVALADVVAALAELAATRDYCRPAVDGGSGLRIVRGRHPVVECSLVETRFVPNDTQLEAGRQAIAVLTGPNMGGKSTYLRQVALIVLLAQSGSFVPASEVALGVVDRIFCRVGASDSLAEGQSTFMVELSETANILHHATPRSLILLDEVGRGTSTFDGLSLAWAVVEHLDALPGGAPRTLFATHYHELTELETELTRVLNLRMAVRESDEGVAFLHRVERGAADRSYGIEVARLAGMPQAVVARAREILDNIERDEYGRDGLPRRARRPGGTAHRPRQPTLFGEPAPAPGSSEGDVAAIVEELRGLEPERLTPIDSLNLLAAWRKRLAREREPSS